MGFTVAGPDRFLASGHPDLQSDLPPQLGLQRSTDGGRSWQSVSLLGEVDLHVLRAVANRVYGIDSGTGLLLASGDGGRSWDARTPPPATFDLAVDPGDVEHVITASESGLFQSADGGRTWRPVGDDVTGLLAWPARAALYVVDRRGSVATSSNGGKTFRPVGEIGAQPEAFSAAEPRELYAAVAGGKVLSSTDGGASWRTRSTP
jgi:photosystem II stability/assembly factor-like uncharacterized protein